MDQFLHLPRSVNFSKMISSSSVLLLLLSVTSSQVITSPSTPKFTYTENCFIQENSKVAWVVSFTNTTFNENEEMIHMQTQSTSPFKGEWRNLTTCQQFHTPANLSLLCQLDDHWFRLTYNVRVVRMRKDAPRGDQHHVVMFQKNDQYQHGLLCFKDHGVRNLTYSHLTKRTVTVVWSRYVWDVEEDLIKDTALLLYYKGEAGMQESGNAGRMARGGGLRRRISVRKNSHLQQIYTIRWLTPCTNYRLVVETTYFSIASAEKRNSSVDFRTECYRERSSSTLMFTTLELVLVNVCVVLLLIFVMVGCRVYRNARWDILRRKETSIDHVVLIEDEGFFSLTHHTSLEDGQG